MLTLLGTLGSSIMVRHIYREKSHILKSFPILFLCIFKIIEPCLPFCVKFFCQPSYVDSYSEQHAFFVLRYQAFQSIYYTYLSGLSYLDQLGCRQAKILKAIGRV